MPGARLRLWINGELRELAAGTTLAELVRELGLEPARVAVERNQLLVPRAEHARTLLVEGDRLEIVTLVGGG